MSTQLYHGQMSSVDESGNVTILHQETSASDVLVDRSTNTKIPSDVDTLQKLVNKLGNFAFKTTIQFTDLVSGMVVNNLTTTQSGYVLDARAGKTLGDRLSTVEEFALIIGTDEEDTDLVVPESEINDNTISDTLTWSSTKIKNELQNIDVQHNFYVELNKQADGSFLCLQTVSEIEVAYQKGKPIWVQRWDDNPDNADFVFIPLRQRVSASKWIFSGYTDGQAYDVTIDGSSVTFVYTSMATTNHVEEKIGELSEQLTEIQVNYGEQLKTVTDQIPGLQTSYDAKTNTLTFQ